MATKYFGSNDFTTFLLKLKDYLTGKYVVKEAGKGLSTNDFTNEYKDKVDAGISGGEGSFSGNWSDLTGTPPAVSTFDNDSKYITNSNNSFLIGGLTDKSYIISDGSTNPTENVNFDGIYGFAMVDDLDSGDVTGGIYSWGSEVHVLADELQFGVGGTSINNAWVLNMENKPTSTQVDTKIATATSGLATEAYVDNKIVGVYTVKGSCTTASLPSSGQVKGDVWNLTDAGTYGSVGTNVVWNGTDWDALGGTIEMVELTSDEINTIWDGVFTS